jgi:hypothetical protein
MVLTWRKVLVFAVVLLALVGAAVMLFPRGKDVMVARRTTQSPAQTVRQCLADKLGLTWQGDAHAMRARAFSLRVVVVDNGKTRQVGMFTSGGRQLGSSENEALATCVPNK